MYVPVSKRVSHGLRDDETRQLGSHCKCSGSDGVGGKELCLGVQRKVIMRHPGSSPKF